MNTGYDPAGLASLILSHWLFSGSCVHVCVLSLFSCVQLFVTPHCSPPGSSVHGILQARILEGTGLPYPLPEHLPDPGIKPTSPASPILQANSLPLAPPGKPFLAAESLIKFCLNLQPAQAEICFSLCPPKTRRQVLSDNIFGCFRVIYHQINFCYEFTGVEASGGKRAAALSFPL